MREIQKLTREEIIKRIREGILSACENVVGIILFGSFARGGEYRDVDLIVVLERLDKPLLERAGLEVEIRRAIGLTGLDVDVLIYDWEEFQDDLRSRFPLLLDAAFDGLVIYDAGEITPALEAAREDVKARGIKRTETGGWQFPVAYRKPTPLSPITNTDWATKWLDDAQRDLKAAEALFQADLYDRCVTHCQQTIEKSIKAILACFGRWERTHYVSEVLLQELNKHNLGDWAKTLTDLAQDAARLEPAAIWSRYPRRLKDRIILPVEQYGEKDAEEALAVARKAYKVAVDFVQWWFGVS